MTITAYPSIHLIYLHHKGLLCSVSLPANSKLFSLKWSENLEQKEKSYPNSFRGAEIKRNGETIVVPLEFGFIYDISKPRQEQEFYPSNSAVFGYYLDLENRICHFRLSECQFTENYLQFLKTMFRDIKDKRIEIIIVDLRGNTGGNSQVVNEFLKNKDIEEYKIYGCTKRMSRAAAEQRGYIISRGSVTYKPSVINNNRVGGCYLMVRFMP